MTDTMGRYSFPDLTDGMWKLHVQMQCFEQRDLEITVGSLPTRPEAVELTLLPLEAILAESPNVVLKPALPAGGQRAETKRPADATSPPAPSDDANEGLLVNGSSSNAATSKYSMAQAFGNQRSGSTALYTGGLAIHLGDSALDARPYSITGVSQPKSSYSQVTMVASLGGPLLIPHLLPRGPSFSFIYQWTRDNNAQALSGLVPTLTQRDPGFTVDPVAVSLLALYPLPNLNENSSYNYQAPVVNGEHDDVAQLRMDKSLGQRDTFNGSFNVDNIRQDSTNLVGFRDAIRTLGLNASLLWRHRLLRSLYGTFNYSFSRVRIDVTP